ncbi:MAG TPA: hypothetical protein VK747_13960 [Blastocatellia bacterium]|nr:hypothetical protein [Blastocatellia bacterium]
MSSLTTALIVFACLFISMMLGFFLRGVAPQHHLETDSKDTVKLATGLIATLSALVLGLLVASARDSFNQVSGELMRMAVRVVLLDRVLAQYGPDAKEIRVLMKTGYSTASDLMLSGEEAQQMQLDTPEALARWENIQAKLRELSPQSDAQRGLKSRALEISDELTGSRWLLIVQSKGSVSMPLLVVLVFWLSMIFTAWSVYAPRNTIVTAALLACAMCVSGAIFLILEMDSPMTGLIRVSGTAVRAALSHLGE